MSNPETLKKFSKFGNDSGEQEDEGILEQYFCESDYVEDFYDKDEPFLFVKAKKGVGKSALLKHTKIKTLKRDPKAITISVKGSDISAPFLSESEHAATSINSWMSRLCSAINRELGNKIDIALTDDEILLVEQSELTNYKGKNLVGSLSSRLKLKLFGTELDKNSPKIESQKKILERYSSENAIDVWLFIDDIDATFKSQPNYITYLATFFSACRDLSYAVEGLKIRASIRADVWPILRTHDESMDHCEQYMRSLRWNDNDIVHIIGKKIFTFCNTYQHFEFPNNKDFYNTPIKQSQLLLAKNYPWYSRRVYSVVPLSSFSYGRPRWSAKLLREAAKIAARNGNKNIKWSDLTPTIPNYSRQRYMELLAEHRHQFPNLEKLFEIFAHNGSAYTTEELLMKVDQYVKVYGKPCIDGSETPSSNLEVAHFLYRTGFIIGRSKENRSFYVEFEDRPTLLLSEANLDDGLEWNIPMCYRRALSIDLGND
ncbi:TPA: hypothetical protein ACN34I_003497 [Vibrio parahaemolyticus]